MSDIPPPDTPVETTPRYSAFISYSHADKLFVEPGVAARSKAFAIWLQRKLESYRVPESLRRHYARSGKILPRRLGRVFRDDDELGAEEDLGPAIEDALTKSNALLVLCSPRSARSKYVAQEIETFRSRRPNQPIIAAVLEGTPHCPDEDRECFPAPLRMLPGPGVQEPIAADLTQFDRNTVFLKIVAGLLDIEFAKLRDREKAAERVRRATAAALFAGGIFLSVVASLGVMATLRVAQREAQRTSNTLGRLALAAADANQYERAVRFGLAGMAGADAPILGFDASRAETALLRAFNATETLGVAGTELRGVHAIAADSRGTTVAIAADSGAAILQTDVMPFRVRHLDVGETPQIAAAVSRDGRYVLLGGIDDKARLFSIDSGKLIATLRDDAPAADRGNIFDVRGGISALAFSADSTRFSIGGDSGVVSEWDLAGKSLRTFRHQQARVGDLQYAASGGLLIATIDEAALYPSGSTVADFRIPGSAQILSAAVSATGNVLAIVRGNGDLEAHNVQSRSLISRINTPAKYTANISLSADGAEVSLAEVGAFRVQDGKQVRSADYAASTYALAGPYWAGLTKSGAHGGLIGQGQALREFPEAGGETVAITLVGRDRVASVTEDGLVRLWNFDARQAVARIETESHTFGANNFSKDGQHIVAVDDVETISLRETKGGRVVTRLSKLAGYPTYLQLSDDGRSVAILSDMGMAQLWKFSESTARAIPAAANEVRAIAFTPDGQRLATLTFSGSAQLWNDAGQPTAALTPTPHDRLLRIGVAFGGQSIVARSADRRVHSWSSRDGRYQGALAGGQPARVFQIHKNGAVSIIGENGDISVYRTSAEPPIQIKVQGAIAVNPADNADVVEVVTEHDRVIWSSGSISRWRFRPDQQVSSKLSPDGSRIVAFDGEAVAMRFPNGRVLELERANQMRSLTFSADSRWFMYVTSDAVVFRDSLTGQVMQKVPGSMRARSLALSPDASALAVGESGQLTIWDTSQFRLRRRELVSTVCASLEKRAAGLDRFTDEELDDAPMLDPISQRHACSIPSPWRRLANELRL